MPKICERGFFRDQLVAGFVMLFVGAAQTSAQDAAEPQREDPLSELEALSQSDDDNLYPDIDDAPAREPVALTVRALNKVTAKYTDIRIEIDDTASFGTLSITPRFCDTRPPEEFPETSAFLQIADRGLGAVGADASMDAASFSSVNTATTDASTPEDQRPDYIFSGWMFASSPALHPLEHAIYDVWVINCETRLAENE